MRIIIPIFCVLSIAAAAQESVVFLKPVPLLDAKPSRRPPAVLKKVIPQIQQSNPISTIGEFPNINISQAFTADQNETSVAISPLDPKRIIVGANDYRSFNALWRFLSTDGGITWDAEEMHSATNLSYATDPSVGYHTNGDAFYVYGRVNHSGSPYPGNDVVCFRSTNGGLSFPDPVVIASDTVVPTSASVLADKYYVGIDNTGGPYHGRLYVFWAEYQGGLSSIAFSYSSDNGLSWSASKRITTLAKYQAPVPAILPDGTVLVTFLSLDTASSNIYVVRITGGGTTHSDPIVVSSYKHLGRLYPEGASEPYPVIKGHLRVNSFPSVAVDRSSKFPGRAYIVWSASGTDSKPHIYLSKSDNGGLGWSVPIAIDNDTSSVPTDKFFPWAAVDHSTGDLGVIFYDSRNDGARNQLIDTYMAHSTDGGASFALARISDEPFDPSVSSSTDSLASPDTLVFFGDYNAIAGINKHWYPVWTDSRSGYDQDIYTAIVQPYAPMSITRFTVSETTDHYPELQWTYTPQTVFGRPLGDHHFRLRRTDNGLDTNIQSSIFVFKDRSAQADSSYTYTIQVIGANGDTSISRTVSYSPRLAHTPQPLEILSSKALSDGFELRFRIPSMNEAGGTITGLQKIYFYLDEILHDSASINDGLRGAEFDKPFTAEILTYHNVHAVVSARASSNVVYLSRQSSPVWLYSGDPLFTYTENFLDSKRIYSPFGWDTVRIGSTVYLNDSLSGIPYQKNISSWFLLPSIKVSPSSQTLEFDHIALVASGDSAVIEYSTDNGVHFHTKRFFDRSAHPSEWTTDVHTSAAVHEEIGFASFNGSDLIVRFRLATRSDLDDGWYITNLRFTDKMSARTEDESTAEVIVMPQPVSTGKYAQLQMSIPHSSLVSVSLSDALGRNIGNLFHRSIDAGQYRFGFTAPKAGLYFMTMMCRSNDGITLTTAKLLVTEGD